MVTTACAATPGVRLSRVLKALGVARSVWYACKTGDPKKPGRRPKAAPAELAEKVRSLAGEYPWWGYKRTAVVARRAGVKVTNRQACKVMNAAGLQQKRRTGKAELDQAARLFERLPNEPNELWSAIRAQRHQAYRGCESQ